MTDNRTEPEQWARETLFKVCRALEGYCEGHPATEAALTIQRAFEERLYLELAKQSLAENTAKAIKTAQARGYRVDPRLVALEDRAWASTLKHIKPEATHD